MLFDPNEIPPQVEVDNIVGKMVAMGLTISAADLAGKTRAEIAAFVKTLIG